LICGGDSEGAVLALKNGVLELVGVALGMNINH